MAKYMLLIHASDIEPPEGLEARRQKWFDYTQDLIDAGVHVAGDALQGADTATTVRVRDGERLISDGPYAETKELLGGYYIIDVPDLDAALDWAAKIPNVHEGATEVRPVMELVGMP